MSVKKKALILFLVATCASVLLWTGCSSPGGGSSEPLTTTIKGTTLYSADGGSTIQPANFQFDVPTTATKGFGARAASSDWIPVSGLIRAGDILINLSGTFNSTTKEFNLRASGVVLTIRIDITIKGLYTASTGAISQGQTDVAVTDMTAGTTQTFSTATVSEGQDAAVPIADAPTTATPPTAAQTKFWEGVWGGETINYFNSDGSTSTTATTIYQKLTASLTCTATQFQERIVESVNFPPSWGYTPQYSFYQTGTFLASTMDETTPNLVIGIVNATQYNDDGYTEHGFMKVYGTLTSAGKLSGGGYYSIDPFDGQHVYLFPTIAEAQAATIQDTSTNNLVVSRID